MWLIVSILQVLVLLGLDSGPQAQMFLDTDGDTATGYYISRAGGADYLWGWPDEELRSTLHGAVGRGGWGTRVLPAFPMYVEFYDDGVWSGSCTGTCLVNLGSDYDKDGDVDLQDFASFQLAFTGPGDSR